MAKRKSSEVQVEGLLKLLSIWPTCTIKIAQKYLFQTYQVKMGRASWQEVRKRLGLSVPQYTENTVRKRAFIRLSTSLVILNKGFNDPKLVKRLVRRNVVEQFDEDINTVLLNSWVEEVISEVVAGSSVDDIAADARADCMSFKIKSPKKGKQQELL
jgi:hypothetical protein